MPLRNRVDPWGRLHAVTARGALMGNRGILHDGSRDIVRSWAGKAWITCVLEFRDVRRAVFSEGTYTELFFLDEATAFAAGHRPCAYCRRQRFTQFKAAWLAANASRVDSENVPIRQVDRTLHAERTLPGGGKVTFPASLGSLPCGTMFESGNAAHLLWRGKVRRWSFDGYTECDLPAGNRQVRVLTPASVVRMFETGFTPDVHASAGG